MQLFRMMYQASALLCKPLLLLSVIFKLQRTMSVRLLFEIRKIVDI